MPRWAAKRSKVVTGSVAMPASLVWPDGLWKVNCLSWYPVTSGPGG